MITGAHVIIYSRGEDADRAFLRDVLALPNVDAGGGRLIFKLPPAEIALHSIEGDSKHELYLICDEIEETLAELRARGVEVSQPITDRGWGLLASIKLPSGAELSIYEPRHARPT